MLRYLPITLVAGLLLVDGFVYGRWTNRWQPPLELRSAAERLDRVPLVIGDWRGEELSPLGQREIEQAGFARYLNRMYKNHQTGAVVRILLACGPPGPIAVHTPDICYRGAGYQAVAPSAKHVEKAGGGTAEMWQGQFTKNDLGAAVHVNVFWSWNQGNGWNAPDNPRLAFGGRSALFKLYVIQEATRDDQEARKARSEFFSVFLPVLDKNLFPKS